MQQQHMIPSTDELKQLSGMMDFVTLLSNNKDLKAAVKEIIERQAEVQKTLDDNKTIQAENAKLLKDIEDKSKKHDQLKGQAIAEREKADIAIADAANRIAQLASARKDVMDNKKSQDKLMAAHSEAMSQREREAQEKLAHAEKLKEKADNLIAEYGAKLDKLKEITG